MSTVYHLGSGLIYDCLLSNKSERYCVINHMEKLVAGDVLVLDHGYFSYLVLYQATEKNVHLICRLQSGTVKNEVARRFKTCHKGFRSGLTKGCIIFDLSLSSSTKNIVLFYCKYSE